MSTRSSCGMFFSTSGATYVGAGGMKGNIEGLSKRRIRHENKRHTSLATRKSLLPTRWVMDCGVWTRLANPKSHNLIRAVSSLDYGNQQRTTTYAVRTHWPAISRARPLLLALTGSNKFCGLISKDEIRWARVRIPNARWQTISGGSLSTYLGGQCRFRVST